MPAGPRFPRSAEHRSPARPRRSTRQGAVSRLMLLVVIFAAVSCCLALIWVATRFTQSIPRAAAETSTPNPASPREPVPQPAGQNQQQAAQPGLRSADSEPEAVTLSEAERERIRQLTRTLSEARLSAPEPVAQLDTRFQFQPGVDGYYDEEQEADLRAAGVKFPARPVVEYKLPVSREEIPSPYPDAGPPDTAVPADTTNPGSPVDTPGPPRATPKAAAEQPGGEQTLSLWNQLNVIIAREAEMRAVPPGGLTEATTDDFLARRAAACRYAAEAISELKITGVDAEVTRLAARLSQWYYAGIDITENGRLLIKTDAETRRGPRGQAWRARQEKHNAQVAELNSAAAAVREQMQQKYQLAFPPLK